MNDIFATYKHVLTALMLCVGIALSSCEDSLIYEQDDEITGEGVAAVRLTATFRPMEIADMTSSRSGDNLHDDIDNLSVLIYDLSGSLIPDGYFYFENGIGMTTSPGVALDGAPTERVTVNDPIHIPLGKYRIYAVANAGNLWTKNYNEIQEEELMRTIKVAWRSDDIGANSQMSGWFHTESGSSGTSHDPSKDQGYPTSYSNGIENVKPVTINGNKTLHAWLRRLSAKVTIDFDGTHLNEKTWIYIRSVRIRNIAEDCLLVANNSIVPGEPDKERPETDAHDPANDITEGEVHFYESHEAEAYALNPDDYSNYLKWPCIASGNGHFGSHVMTTDPDNPDWRPFTALYAFENLQGDAGKDKKQQPIEGDVNNLDYTWRDACPSGTFIEVDAYYISNEEDNEGSGPIRYRFMLGKDIVANYDFERNYHYKLTLMFHGQANNIDWHIDYREEEKPGLYAPDPYYVSYKYNSEMEYPIRIEGEILSEYIDVSILRNDWRPWDKGNNQFPNEHVGDWEWIGKDYVAHGEDASVPDFQGTAVWNGFLSLYDPSARSEVFKNAPNNKSFNKRDWYRIPNEYYPEYDGTAYDVESYSDRVQSITYDDAGTMVTVDNVTKDEGYRRYKVPTADGTYIYNTATGDLDYSKSYGSYRVVKKGSVTTFYIPLYTRPIILTTTTSYTGNNPFYSYMRRAKINIHAVIKNKQQEPEDFNREKVVYQVRRQINPSVVMRRHDNTNCFTVQLLVRQGEEHYQNFEPFRSLGPWEANIVSGEGWEIVGHNSGRTESFISFTVRPKEKIEPHETRCAKVEVWYNNRACRHVILLRQGYAPIYMEAKRPAQDGIEARSDKVLWHSFNLWWNDADGPREADCPLDAGSFFRKHANYEDPIDAINNNYSPDPNLSDFGKSGRYNSTGTSRDQTTGYFWLSPIKNNVLKTWAEIGSTTGKFNELTMYGATVRPAKASEWDCFIDNPNIDFVFGIGYGDGAYTVQKDPNKVSLHSYVAKMPKSETDKYLLEPYNIVGEDPNGAFGTRVCAVYNSTSVHCPVLVLPMGPTGYGRRTLYKNFSKTGSGELRYANRYKLMVHGTDAALPYQPLLYAIYANYGAIYWSHETDKTKMSWDINYSTYDFNYFSLGQDDANYVRFVQPRTGTGSVTLTAENPCWDADQTEKVNRPGY